MEDPKLIIFKISYFKWNAYCIGCQNVYNHTYRYYYDKIYYHNEKKYKLNSKVPEDVNKLNERVIENAESILKTEYIKQFLRPEKNHVYITYKIESESFI